MQTNDRPISELMISINKGAIQLPDFQRGWVWEDGRIKALIASITNNYPVGAAMFLEYGNDNIRFKYRVIEGVTATDVIPTELILDGQQRLTSIYSSLYSRNAVHTRTDKGKKIFRYYYIDIKKACDPNCDRVDAIFSVPETRIITSNFGRDIELDLSDRTKEFENKMFPLNLILDFPEEQNWQNEYYAFYNYNQEIIKEFTEFNKKIIMQTLQYKIPVISLGKDTPKEAVCQVFENVNTGGVSLTVFELVTAIFAMDDFELRKDWEERKAKYFDGDLLSCITATDFLTACTLLSTYKKGGTVSCKKKDVLNLSLKDYNNFADALSEGFVEAEKILQEERVFSNKDLPYSTQLIPLAALCTLLSNGNRIKVTNIKNKIRQWYWCGVFGELYGGANETRYVNDVVGVMNWIENNGNIPKTIQESYFNPTRLLTLQSRQSAAYKGIMALILKNHCKDFISGREMDFTVYKSENIDIHHIFPKSYCGKNNLPKEKWNSVVNKTPISYSTNREIGGVAPSEYLKKIEEKGQVDYNSLNDYLQTHLIDVSAARSNDFEKHIVLRAKLLLDAIEKATGKIISGKDSDEVISKFGKALYFKHNFLKHSGLRVSLTRYLCSWEYKYTAR